jgi:hypothetical protein
MLDLSVTTHCSAFRVYAPIHNLVTYHLDHTVVVSLLILDFIGLLSDCILKAVANII